MRDRGAHFHRCDFQVHTPRDAQWQGTRPTNDVEQRTYAMDFVAACRKKGLGAVAIGTIPFRGQTGRLVEESLS